MQKCIITFLLLFIFLGAWTVQSFKTPFQKNKQHHPTPLGFTIPKGWPQPHYDFKNNPLTQQGFELGRKLFYDGKLSKDGNFACASCHQQFAAFATLDHPFSHGYNNGQTTRNAPGLFNLAWQPDFMWDGSIHNLDEQPLFPMTAPNEMAETIDAVLVKLRSDSSYRRLFKVAFGTTTITTQRITKAISQFLVMIASNNSKYDRVIRGEDSFNLPQRLGYEIFKTKCTGCHPPPMFTDYTFRNIGLPVDEFLNDSGRMRTTLNSADSLRFRVPSLRNVQVTFPYGHDGRFYSLNSVMEHYNSKVKQGPTTDPLVGNFIPLSNFEIGQLKAFLYTLTDSALLKDKRFMDADYVVKPEMH